MATEELNYTPQVLCKECFDASASTHWVRLASLPRDWGKRCDNCGLIDAAHWKQPARPAGPSPAAVQKYNLKDLLAGTPSAKPAAAQAPTQAPGGLRTIPSAHGGKPIPVVPSRSAIAAAQKAATARASAVTLGYKDHILIGIRADEGRYDTKVIERWPYLPSQTEIDAALAKLKYTYVSFALTNPVNVWGPKSK